MFHGTERPLSSPGSWSIESSTPAKHNIVALVLSLLEVLELPQAATLSSATEALLDIRFICLVGTLGTKVTSIFKGLWVHSAS